MESTPFARRSCRGVVIAALVVAALSDAVSYTIPNRCPLAILAAFAVHGVFAPPETTLYALVTAIAVFAAGLLFIVARIALAVLPGPLTIPPVLLGLWIWSTEFEWAHRLLRYVRERYDKVMDWFARQPAIVQILGGLLTALFVAGTLWVLGALGWAADLLGLDWDWVNSPVGLGS